MTNKMTDQNSNDKKMAKHDKIEITKNGKNDRQNWNDKKSQQK